MATINQVGNSLTGSTGSGAFVGSTSPTLVTPNIGVATATSINFGGTALSNYTENDAVVPTITFATPGDLSVVYTVQQMYFTRIGRENYVAINLSFTPTYVTASGTFLIGTLPVAVANGCGGELIDVTSTLIYPAGGTTAVIVNGTTTTNLAIRGFGSAANALFSTTQFLSGIAWTVNLWASYAA